ncbi:MAG TPA: ABC transporter permease, partial [Firmicutes bacterium]|nr:ABC transporter permease [Bacillota bacterium]
MQSRPMTTSETMLQGRMASARSFLVRNMVTIMFLVLSAVGYKLSGMTPFLFLMDIVARLSRNAFLVLALIIPVMAGMGLNFSIVLGAMAAQAIVIFVTHWGFAGLPGILLSMALVTPLAAILGYLTGSLFNRTKGQEMIAGLILGYFAQGIYELVFLQLVGGIIPMDNSTIIM